MNEGILLLIYGSESVLPQIGVYTQVKVDLDNEKAIVKAVKELREGLNLKDQPKSIVKEAE